MPINANGIIIAISRIGVSASSELKSLEIKLIILPNYWDFAVYWEILDSFVYIIITNVLLTLATK